MSTKIYKAHNNLSVPLIVGGKIVRYVNFRDENNTFRTSDELLQNALEHLPCYGDLFKLYRQEETSLVQVPVGAGGQTKEYSEITEWQDAKDLLRKDYNVAHQSLNTPENILKKAAEAGVLFPNLKQVQE